MPCSLPPEILDLTIDHLHDDSATLKACCLVSESWVPRARKHLFAHVEFYESASPIESWMTAFPDPSNSPAHHTRTLAIIGVKSFSAAGTDVGRWVRTFHSVVHLHMEICNTDFWDRGRQIQVSLLPFYGLSPAVRSLHLESASDPSAEILNLMCSFPLLADFTFIVFDHKSVTDEWTTPLASPRLTGSLKLSGSEGEIGPTTRRLLDLPDGLHFTKIVLVLVDEADPKSATDLVSRCSHTLESLDITEELIGECPSPPVPS